MIINPRPRGNILLTFFKNNVPHHQSDNRQGYNSSDIDDVLEDRRHDRQGGRGHSRGVVQELRGRGTADRRPKVTEGCTSDGAGSAAGHNTFV